MISTLHKINEKSRDINFVLIVDDSSVTISFIQRVLEKGHFRVLTAATVSEASNIIGNNNVGVVLIDYDLAGINEGTVLIEKIKKYKLNILTFAISSSSSSNKALKECGCNGFIGKDAGKIRELLDSLRSRYLSIHL